MGRLCRQRRRALGYGALKLSWALGGTPAVGGTPQWERPGAADGLGHFIAFDGTALLAIVAAAILLALVKPWGRRMLHRPARGLAWLSGAMMLPAGFSGSVMSLAPWTGLSEPGNDGGLAPARSDSSTAAFSCWDSASPRRPG